MVMVDMFRIRGSRYAVVQKPLDPYPQYRYANRGRATENVLGTAQETWFKEQVMATNTWKVIVSTVSFTSRVWDLRAKTDIPDATLRQRFYFNVDQWDGFPT